MVLSRSLYQRLNTQHETIAEIISGVPSARMTYHPLPEKWSIMDNIAHLAKYQPVFHERIELILKDTSPVFDRYKAENDPDFESWRKMSIQELLKRLNADRQIIFNTISRLNDAQLNMTGIHKKFGKLTMTQWTEFFLLHESHHIFTIFQLAHDGTNE
jgi:hypothetical protein